MIRPLILLAIALLFSLSPRLEAQDRFEQTDGPYGGNIFSAAIASDGTVYVVTGNNEVARSENNGASWIRCAPRAVHRVAVDSSGNVYAGYDFGIYRSSDRGRTWTQHVAGVAVPSLNSFTQVYLLETGTTGTIYLGYNSRLYRSIDRGESWSEITVRADRPLVRDISVGSAGVVYAGVDGGIYRSSDDGASWSRLGLAVAASDTVTLVTSAPGGLMWARVAPQYNLYHSTDAGETWSLKESLGLPPNTAMRDLVMAPSGTLYAGMESGLYRSTDRGNRWSATGGTGVERNLVPAVVASPAGSVFAGASDLYRSTDDGSVWSRSTAGMIATAVYGLEQGIDGSILAGTVNNLFRSSDNGATWSESRSGIPENVRINDLHRSGGVVIASTSGSGLYRSTNNGQTWSAGNVGLSSSTVYRVIALTSGDLLAATADGVFRSTNAGASWSLSNNGMPGLHVRDLAEAAPGVVVAATRGAGIYRSIDNGASWVDANSGQTESAINAIVATRRGTLFAGGDHIYRSTDLGLRWEQVSYDVATSHIAELAVDAAGAVYVATHFPVRTTDNGNTWSPHIEIPFLTNTHVRSYLPAADGSLYLGTDGAGVARLVPDNGDRWETLVNAPAGTSLFVGTPLRSSLVGPTTFAFKAPLLYAATSAGVYRSSNEGLSWEGVGAGTGAVEVTAVAEMHAASASIPWIGLTDGVAFLDPVTGAWVDRKSGWPGGRAHALAIVNVPGPAQVYAATDHGVWVLNGESWSAVRDGIGDRAIVALQIAHDGTLLAAADNGTLFRSNAARTSWSTVTQGLTAAKIVSFAADPSGNIYAGTEDLGVYRSTDNGIGWSRSHEGLPAGAIRSLSSSSHGVLFAATGSGIYRSTNAGTSWSLVDAGAGSVTSLFVAGNGRIFAATAGGVRRSIAVDGTSAVATETNPLSTVGISIIDGGTDEAIVRYRIGGPGSVEIALYDQTGSIVRTMPELFSGTGEGELRITTEGMPAGIYYVRLLSDAGVASSPLVIVR